eukprot:SM000141S00928  [mRNA]  locus=s141:303723:303993:+ [translate_table: standard]
MAAAGWISSCGLPGRPSSGGRGGLPGFNAAGSLAQVFRMRLSASLPLELASLQFHAHRTPSVSSTLPRSCRPVARGPAIVAALGL